MTKSWIRSFQLCRTGYRTSCIFWLMSRQSSMTISFLAIFIADRVIDLPIFTLKQFNHNPLCLQPRFHLWWTSHLLIPEFFHISPILKSLHWLKIRIKYKLLSLTYKVITTAQPGSLSNLMLFCLLVEVALHLLLPSVVVDITHLPL